MNPKSRTPGMLAIAAIAAMSAIGGLALAQDADDPLGERRALDPEAIVHVQPMNDGPFFDRWYAWPLVEFDEPVPGLFNVLRDGKSGELSATLAVDCEARTSKWEGGVVYGSELVGEDYFATQVPPEVAHTIIERHCADAAAKSENGRRSP